ncbi:MAG TPA: SET domain-containing protein-lysine N-methyltransferase [Acidobacteriaceae bacterium]|nr:SET domain-containing protein-lysine N-methyltransferase [Acidobacteriaceae bacterium]
MPGQFSLFPDCYTPLFCFQYPMGLIIRSSTIHAAGCYTTTPIAKGTRVVEYTGPLIDKEEADLRYENKPVTYLFGIGDGSRVIDGHGMAMFINHSCDANCETEEIDGRVWITAIRDIAAGEELCYDYCLYDGGDEEAPCNCGAKKCRGSMYSREELRRRKRLAEKEMRRHPPAKTRTEKPATKRKPASPKRLPPNATKTAKAAAEKMSKKRTLPVGGRGESHGNAKKSQKAQ